MSFKKSFFKNVLTYGSLTYSSNLISFVAFTILSRLLLPSEYGFVALITVFTGFITIFADGGLSIAIVRTDYRTTFHKAVNNLTLLLGVALFLVVALLAWPIAWFYEDRQLVLPTLAFSLVFIFRSFSIVPQAILTKNLEFNYIGRTVLQVNIITSLLSILLAWLNFSYWALIIPQVFHPVLVYFLYNSRVKMPFRFYPHSYTLVGFKKAKWLMKNILGFNLINYWARNADNLIVGKFYGKADLGIYSKAYSLLTLPLSMISVLFGTILFPSLKQLKSQGGDILKEYSTILGVVSLINWPVAVVLVVFAYPLVDILWGDSWISAAKFLPYFGVLVLTQTLVSTTGSLFILLNRERVMLWTGVASAFFLVASIAIGALLSVLDVARFYALGFLLLNVPIILYFGFVRTFGFTWHFILTFWVPKIALSLLLIFSIWVNRPIITIGLLLVYLLHLLVLQRKDIGLAAGLLKKALKKA